MDTTGQTKRPNPKTPCGPCAKARWEKRLTGLLILLSVLVSVWFCTTTYKDYNRFELYLYHGFEEPLAYKLDKKTGKVTIYNQLWEFETEKFSDPDKTTKHWQFPNRMHSEMDLLLREELLQ